MEDQTRLGEENGGKLGIEHLAENELQMPFRDKDPWPLRGIEGGQYDDDPIENNSNVIQKDATTEWDRWGLNHPSICHFHPISFPFVLRVISHLKGQMSSPELCDALFRDSTSVPSLSDQTCIIFPLTFTCALSISFAF
jgi:hypothetical protein